MRAVSVLVGEDRLQVLSYKLQGVRLYVHQARPQDARKVFQAVRGAPLVPPITVLQLENLNL